jgi:hypothetical protein
MHSGENYSVCRPRVGNLSPVATSGELAMKVWQLVRQKYCQISHYIFHFFQLNQFVSLFASHGSCNLVVEMYMF